MHEKMCNIAPYWRHANQNYNELSPHTGQNGHQQKVLKKNAREDVEKRKHSCTVGGNVS